MNPGTRLFRFRNVPHNYAQLNVTQYVIWNDVSGILEIDPLDIVAQRRKGKHVFRAFSGDFLKKRYIQE